MNLTITHLFRRWATSLPRQQRMGFEAFDDPDRDVGCLRYHGWHILSWGPGEDHCFRISDFPGYAMYPKVISLANPEFFAIVSNMLRSVDRDGRSCFQTEVRLMK